MRTVLVRLESPLHRAVAAGLALAVGGLIAAGVVRRAAAGSLAARIESAAGAERAVARDPGNPDIRLAAADAHLAAGEGDALARARAHLEAALRRRPAHAGTWLRLAMLHDREGDRARAQQALATAVRHDRHSVSLRWEAALLALRWGEREAALEHFRYVLEVDPSRRDAAFQLARALLAPGEPVSTLLPADAGALTAILALAIRDRDLDLATAAWERRSAVAPPGSLDLQFLDFLVAEGRGALARRVWTAIAPAGGDGDPRNAVWNGGFEQPKLTGSGFDWQLRRVWGVEVRLDAGQAAEGRRSLRLAFNSYPTLDFAGVSQLVAVEPGRYDLAAQVRAEDFVTRSGLKLQVVTPDGDRALAETEAVAGTTPGWRRVRAVLAVPEGVSLVRVRLRREPAHEPEGNLGGRVWVDDVSLTPAEAGS